MGSADTFTYTDKKPYDIPLPPHVSSRGRVPTCPYKGRASSELPAHPRKHLPIHPIIPVHLSDQLTPAYKQLDKTSTSKKNHVLILSLTDM